MYRITDLVSSQELYHHGIKGQKWGRRRFQNEDGSLTPAGKERYDDDGPSEKKQKQYKIPEKKSTHRLKLEEKFEAQGMTKQQAEQAAAKRIRGEQYAVAAAAITVTACVAYNKYKGYNVDKTLSTNTDLHRVMRMYENQEVRGGRQYMSYKKTDQIKYKGALADDLQKKAKSGQKLYDVTVKPQQDIKIASPKRVQNTFNDLYKNDKDFKKAVNELGLVGGSINPKFEKVAGKMRRGEELNKQELKKAYDLFNVGLVQYDAGGEARANKFYDALKKQGVNAIQDVNDKKYSGYKAKAPIITFDGKYDYIKREMGAAEIEKNKNTAIALVLAPTAVKAGATYTGFYAASKWADRRAIDKYRKEHPNTELTDKEINKLLNRGY